MLINVNNVCFSYKNKKDVINKLNLKIKENTIHAILGHNGAGKTTLFNLIIGVLKYHEGSIIINKDLINDKKDISLMPEHYGVYRDLTIFENMRFRYRLSNRPQEDMVKNIEALAKIFGIEKRLDDNIKGLSNGLEKRAALACAIIGKPKLLLLDEPTNAIDPSTHEILIKMLLHLKSNGMTIIINSHDLDFVSRVADEITIINNGTNVYNGIIESKEKLEKVYFSYTENVEEIDYENF